MQRFFYDYTAKNKSLLDYSGQEFRNAQGAIEFAFAIADDLKHSLSGSWIGWSVEVRNAHGEKLLSLPVQSELVSAA